MKSLIVIAALAVLGGCAAAPAGPPSDPSQWRVVSVTPVAPGTGARMAASGEGSRIDYSSIPVTPAAPVYVPQPVYLQAPPYQPYYAYPPVSIGLDFVFGRHWHSGGHRRGHHRGHR